MLNLDELEPEGGIFVVYPPQFSKLSPVAMSEPSDLLSEPPPALMDPSLHTALSEHPTIDSYISYLIEEDYHFRTNGQQVVVLEE